MSRPLRRLIAQRRAWRFIRRQVAAACAADPKLLALLSHIARQARSVWRLRELLCVAFRCDFKAYGQLGQAITNCGWIKTAQCPLPVALALKEGGLVMVCTEGEDK